MCKVFLVNVVTFFLIIRAAIKFLLSLFLLGIIINH